MDRLVITADDFGYSPRYDAGILAAAEAGAVDSVSAFVSDRLDPTALIDTGVEVGLHLDLGAIGLGNATRAGPAERSAAVEAVEGQLAGFETAFGLPAAYIDGHHHCHARAGLATVVARAAAERDLPLRSVCARHRRLLRCFGVATPDRLVGRVDPRDPPLPDVILRATTGGGELPAGITEWLTHPGYVDPRAGSSYDAEREQDLELLLRLADDEGLRVRRGTHAEALLAR